MAWDSHYPGHLRAINNNVIDMFHLKSLHAIREAQITVVAKIPSTYIYVHFVQLFTPLKLSSACLKKLERAKKDGKEKLLMHFTMELPHWNPPGRGHFKGFYDEIIFCTGWHYVDKEMFDKDCLPG